MESFKGLRGVEQLAFLLYLFGYSRPSTWKV